MDISTDFIISVLMEQIEHDRQLLGSMKINLRGMQGNEHGMKHPCHHYNQLTSLWNRNTADFSSRLSKLDCQD
jgi:hypothetical protein